MIKMLISNKQVNKFYTRNPHESFQDLLLPYYHFVAVLVLFQGQEDSHYGFGHFLARRFVGRSSI